MRKLFAIATMLVFVFTVSSVYACGEKSSSAKASKASYGSEYGSKATKASTTESGTEKAEVTTTNYRAKTADGNSGCHWKGNATKTGVMKADTGADKAGCPATKDCPVPCNKESRVEKMKAEDSEAPSDDSQASITTVTSSSK
ncbi:MAG: hypothetical protein JSW64_09050 [Candidatus Zixiibacteriota bacterium]|nr:MAG: hypothetical protein JSW64_09050 [candidate division Zixibacteria bacterium]